MNLDIDPNTTTQAPAVHVKETFADQWARLHKTPPPVIGRERAERMGRPDMAEKPIVFDEIAGDLMAADEKTLDLDVVISTDEINRSRHKVHQDGWDLSYYKKYPVVLLGHSYDNPATDIIGKNLNIRIEQNQLVGRDRLLNDSTGQRLFALVDFIGTIGISAGYYPTETKFVDDEKQGPYIEFFSQEKIEHSIVTIPANREGMATAITNGLVSPETFSLLSLTPEGTKAPDESARREDDPLASALLKLDGMLIDLKSRNLSIQLRRKKR